MVLPGTKAIGVRSFDELAQNNQDRTGEDNYEAALKIAKHYAYNTDGQKFVKYYGPENPWWNRLQKEDQERIMEIIKTNQSQEQP